MSVQHAYVFEVLIGQMAWCRKTNPIFSKTLGVLGHAELFEPFPNLLHGGHQRSRRGMTEFSTTATASLYQSIRDTTPVTRTFAVVSRRFQGATGISVSVDPCDPMGQHNAKLMLSTLWCGQLTRLSGGVGARGTKIGIAAPPARTAKHAPLILTH
jgi:hypothetical protein